MSIRVPTEAMLKKMSSADRAALGQRGVTFGEAQEVRAARDERALQKLMAQELNRRDLFHINSRMDKRTTCRRGMPDFIIILPGARALAVEAKMPGGEISDDQQQVFTQFWDQTGEVVHVVMDFDSFRNLLDKHLPS